MGLFSMASIIGTRLNIIDYPDKRRKVHFSPTLRTGGILIFSGFIAGLFITRQYLVFPAMVLCASLIFLTGFIKDMRQLNPKLRLVLHGVIAYLYIAMEGVIVKDLGLFTLPEFMQVPFTVFAIVGVINAYNIIDGLNGLSSGLGLIAALSLGILAYQHNDFELFRVTLAFSGALLGFMILNLRGKIFMGDNGSYLVGFIVSVFSILLVNRNPLVSPFAPLLIAFIPIFDTLFAIYRRKKLKREAFKADARHLHHMLRRRYKSNAKVVIVLLLIQASIALFAVFFSGHTVVLVVITVLSAVFLRRLWFKSIKVKEVVL